jgi:hypothetical protein
MRKILEACPTCGGPLIIAEVRCERCATEVRSHYQPCPFCRLSPEQMNFALLFVQSRGNLSEVEKALGVSYPTIRGKLEEIIRTVVAAHPSGPAPAPAPASTPPPSADDSRRRDILSRVAAGQLSAAEGLAALRATARNQDRA